MQWLKSFQVPTRQGDIAFHFGKAANSRACGAVGFSLTTLPGAGQSFHPFFRTGRSSSPHEIHMVPFRRGFIPLALLVAVFVLPARADDPDKKAPPPSGEGKRLTVKPDEVD